MNPSDCESDKNLFNRFLKSLPVKNDNKRTKKRENSSVFQLIFKMNVEILHSCVEHFHGH